ncbi:hypothetical protein PIB30_110949, partial [Stylosanthes scabra]|nr:hypothetical protein [Stylosanthes scabra]
MPGVTSFWPLAERLVGAPQPARDQQECRLLRWRARLDRVSVEQFRWTPYDSPEMQ